MARTRPPYSTLSKSTDTLLNQHYTETDKHKADKKNRQNVATSLTVDRGFITEDLDLRLAALNLGPHYLSVD